MNPMWQLREWFFFTLMLVIAVYWASNLLLWYPWSFNPTLGMVLMLTVAPLLWAYAIYRALVTYPGDNGLKGAGWVALVFLPTAIIFDYIFFGLIRQAMEELYHPTTLYGYAFLLALPFMIALLFKNRLLTHKRNVNQSEKWKASIIGAFCLIALILIIRFDIRI